MSSTAIGAVTWTLWLEEKIESAWEMSADPARPCAWWTGYHDGLRVVLASYEGSDISFLVESAELYGRPDSGPRADCEASNYLAGFARGFVTAMEDRPQEVGA